MLVRYGVLGMAGICCFALHGSDHPEEFKGRRCSREDMVAAMHEIQTPRRSRLRTENERLACENQSLLEKNEQLQVLVNLCTSEDPTRDISFTQGYIQDLSLAKDRAENAYKDLVTRHTALEATHAKVQAERNSLQQQVTHLTERCRQRQEQYETLQQPCCIHIAPRQEDNKQGDLSVVHGRRGSKIIGALHRLRKVSLTKKE